MPIWGEFHGFIKTMRAYLLGRGMLSLAVMGATAAATSFGWGIIVPAVVAVGGALFSAGIRLHTQALYEDKMTELYREDIALHLGIAPNEVTRDHLKAAARENEVIAQALARQRRINIVSFSTSVLAAAATFGLLYFGLAHHAIDNFFTTHFNGAADILRYTSAGLVSGTSSLILHNGLEEAIGHGTGLAKAAAHDLIVAMDRDVKRGRSIAPEQVYAVLVAEGTHLQHMIATRFNEPFSHMNPREQRAAMDALGVTKDMMEIADIITRGKVRPGRLAYMMHHARPTARTTPETSPPQSMFVEKLGLAPREASSHAAQVIASREQRAVTSLA